MDIFRARSGSEKGCGGRSGRFMVQRQVRLQGSGESLGGFGATRGQV